MLTPACTEPPPIFLPATLSPSLVHCLFPPFLPWTHRASKASACTTAFTAVYSVAGRHFPSKGSHRYSYLMFVSSLHVKLQVSPSALPTHSSTSCSDTESGYLPQSPRQKRFPVW